MEKYGLIGYPLGHSFSKSYFNQKFSDENMDAVYENYEIANIDSLLEIIESNPELRGLNVTIPYKEKVISYLDNISPEARAIGAVNVIKVEHHGGETTLKGYNSDVIGFNWKTITRKHSFLEQEVLPRQSTSVLRVLVSKPYLSVATSVLAQSSIPTSLATLSRNTMSSSTALPAACILMLRNVPNCPTRQWIAAISSTTLSTTPTRLSSSRKARNKEQVHAMVLKCFFCKPLQVGIFGIITKQHKKKERI